MSKPIQIINPKNLKIPDVSETRENINKFIELEKKEKHLTEKLEALQKEIENLYKNIIVYNVNIKYDEFYHLFSLREEAESFANALLLKGIENKDINIEITNHWVDIEYIDSKNEKELSDIINGIYENYIWSKKK
jgi:hypothetical protein